MTETSTSMSINQPSAQTELFRPSLHYPLHELIVSDWSAKLTLPDSGRFPPDSPRVIRTDPPLELSVSDSAIFASTESASGRLPEHHPIRLSMLASDRGAMRATRERYMRTRPP